ncbi:MAG: hypothetical protein Q4B63_11865 [Clostridium perfringens]|nr:hypothetical protein [Clostridium perfringens]
MYGVSILLSSILIILLIVSMFIFVDNIKSIHKSLEKINEYQTKINNNVVSIKSSLEKDLSNIKPDLENNIINIKSDKGKKRDKEPFKLDANENSYDNIPESKYYDMSQEELLNLIKGKQKIFTQEIDIKENNEAVNLNIKIKGK